MKSAYLSFSILVFLVAAIIVNQYTFKIYTDEMLVTLEKIKVSAEQGKIEEAEDYMLEYNTLLDKYKAYISLSVRHDEIDRINEASTKTIEFLKSNNITNFKAEISTLMILIEHINQFQKITLENIL